MAGHAMTVDTAGIREREYTDSGGLRACSGSHVQHDRLDGKEEDEYEASCH